MVSISQVKAGAAAIKCSKKLVYSTVTDPNSKATMFDAFCSTMLKKGNIRSTRRAVMPQLTATKDELLEFANKIIADSGANATATARVKGAKSAEKKIEKGLKEIQKDGYEKARARVQDLIIYEGPASLVNDGYGLRFVINSNKTGSQKTTNLLFDELIKYHNTPNSGLILSEVEDYCGKGISAYAGKRNINNLINLRYVTPGGRKGQVAAAEKIKASGYTRSNVSGYIFGKPAELQVGGVHTTKWGDVEHIIYDARQGKALNLNEFETDEAKEFALKLRTEYDKLLLNKNLHDSYQKNYLNKIWAALVEAEEKNLAVPNYPPLPAGIPDILRAENFMKLAH